jgi:hypothetical protein
MKKYSLIIAFFLSAFMYAQEWETVVSLPGNSPIKQIEIVNTNSIYVSSQYYKLYNWNGTDWASVGDFNPGFNGLFSYVSDDEIYATHNTYINGKNENEVNYLAKWDGLNWTNFGDFNQPKHIYNFRVLSDSEVYAVGAFDDLEDYRWRAVAKFNGSNWSVIGKDQQFGGTYSGNNSLWVNNENDIYSKHDGYRSNGQQFVKHWDGNEWKVLSNGNLDETDGVDRIHYVSENEIYINTWNTNFDYGVIGYWDGDYWKILGDIQSTVFTNGFYGSLDFVFVSSSEIYAFGSALRTSTNYTYQVAVWNGSTWTKLGNLNANKPVTAGFYKDGFLYVGGSFTEGGKTLIKRIDAQKVLNTINFTTKTRVVYPNPVKDICSLNKTYKTVKVYSLLGKELLEQNNSAQINFSNFKKGIYLLELTDDDNHRIIQKIIKN